jgi:hypothetical protein
MTGEKEKFKLKTGRLLEWTKYQTQHSSSVEDKVILRHEMIALLGVDDPKILDVYAGPGTMWDKAYGRTKNYLGLDKEMFKDERRMIVCDNARYLRNCSTLDSFDVFDLDAYGSPFEPLAIICDRITWTQKKRIAVFITDGQGGRAAVFSQLEDKLLKFVGMNRHQGTNVQFKNRDNIIASAIVKCAEIAGAKIIKTVCYGKTAPPQMRYIGFVLEKY